MSVTFSLFRISLPEKSAFASQIKILAAECEKLEPYQRKPPRGARAQLAKTCKLMVEGLFQAYSCHTPEATVSLPLSPQFYSATDTTKINKFSYRHVRLAHNALKSLGWIITEKGYLPLGGKGVPTTMRAVGPLAKKFKSQGVLWQHVQTSADPLVLRSKALKKTERLTLAIPDSAKSRSMRQNLNQINKFIGEQAICIDCTNEQLKTLALEMANGKYTPDRFDINQKKKPRLLNFSHIHLRRIFARGQMDKGGRFYGGFWQNIPSSYRRFVTINGCRTVEVDFNTLHPTLLFLKHGLNPPANFYDLGLRIQGHDIYDPKLEPYRTQRSIIKQFANAIINDERGVFRLEEEDEKFLGMSSEKLRALLIERHPVFEKALNSDLGVQFQFIDSQIAELVMINLTAQNIVCLPVHDSFLVIEEYMPQLNAAMQQGFRSVVNQDPVLKDAELPLDSYTEINESGDIHRVMDENLKAFHNQYVLSWWRQSMYLPDRTRSIFQPRGWLPEEGEGEEAGARGPDTETTM